MSASESNPALHLRPGQAAPAEAVAASVAQANREAAGLTADDARAILAARVADSLDGGRAAILPAQRRQRLLDLARRLGLRPFDANLVIAIVQDGARSGQVHPGGTDPRLALVGAPQRRSGSGAIGLILAAVTIGTGLLAALVAWVLGG